MKNEKLLLRLLRVEFDTISGKWDCRKIIDAAIEVAGRSNDKVQEMISDFEFEFKTIY